MWKYFWMKLSNWNLIQLSKILLICPNFTVFWPFIQAHKHDVIPPPQDSSVAVRGSNNSALIGQFEIAAFSCCYFQCWFQSFRYLRGNIVKEFSKIPKKWTHAVVFTKKILKICQQIWKWNLKTITLDRFCPRKHFYRGVFDMVCENLS